jgi:hypothetical protein
VIQHIDIHSVLRESSAGVYTDLVTRPTGRVVRECIQRVIVAGGVRLGGATAIARMDFSGVGCMDYSCADEIVARLVRDWPAVLLLRNLTDGHREAIQGVLVGRGLAVLVEQPDGTLEVLGTPAAAVELVEQLVTQRLARCLPGGTFALVVT